MVTVGVFSTLMLFLLLQLFLAGRFIHKLSCFRQTLISDSKSLPATIILCLRGADPSLSDCILGALGQDYPKYRLIVIIDDPTDPAIDIVQGLRLANQQSVDVDIQFLIDPGPGRSLKCSALLQAVSSLDHDCHFIALLDADTVPHRTWLRELATALYPPQIGIASGNRWYMPAKLSAGSLIRYLWNANAVVIMYNFNIPWGGTLAIKASLLRHTEILDRWATSLTEDVTLAKIAARYQWSTVLVPSLMMCNRESCQYGAFVCWVQRQLLLVRLYHASWPITLTHGALGAIPPIVAVLIMIDSAIIGTGQPYAWSIVGLAVYEVGIFLLLFPIELAVRRIFRSRDEPEDWIPMHQISLLFLLLPLAQLTHAYALVRSMLLQRVRWRGIDYEITRSSGIAMTSYQPFKHQAGYVQSPDLGSSIV